MYEEFREQFMSMTQQKESLNQLQNISAWVSVTHPCSRFTTLWRGSATIELLSGGFFGFFKSKRDSISSCYDSNPSCRRWMFGGHLKVLRANNEMRLLCPLDTWSALKTHTVLRLQPLTVKVTGRKIYHQCGDWKPNNIWKDFAYYYAQKRWCFTLHAFLTLTVQHA